MWCVCICMFLEEEMNDLFEYLVVMMLYQNYFCFLLLMMQFINWNYDYVFLLYFMFDIIILGDRVVQNVIVYMGVICLNLGFFVNDGIFIVYRFVIREVEVFVV